MDKSPKLESIWIEKENPLENTTLDEFITTEVSMIAFQYMESNGQKMPPKMINAITKLLLNAYHNKEIQGAE